MAAKWYLDRINVFNELSEEDRSFLAQNAIKKHYEKGSTIFLSGDRGDSIFIVEAGTVKIYDVTEGGKESIFWFRYKGEFFGLAEAFGGEERMCFAEAAEPTTILVIRRETLEELMRRNPRVALIVIRVMSARLRRLGEALKALHFQDLRCRLAQLLLNLGNICGMEKDGKIIIEKKFTHQDLASMIGATRQRVTEALNNLAKDGVIHCNGKKIFFDSKGLSGIIKLHD